MEKRKLGKFSVSAIGVGCMSLTHGYGPPPPTAQAEALLNRALDIGYTHFDNAALYGMGASETLLGNAIGHRRNEYILSSKCGISKNADGVREINCRPEVLRATIEDSLRRLKTDRIDLYYLHRWDKAVPIEESIGELSRAVQAGKIQTIGLSEVSAQTLRKAHAVHPITAVQSEYSLWTRNPEIEILQACRELNCTLVAFSPLARQFLTGVLRDANTLHETDLRRNMPRFDPDTYQNNLKLLTDYQSIADEAGLSMAQLALAWVLSKGKDIVAIPGTTNIDHLEENAGADSKPLSPQLMSALDQLINEHTVSGPRYNAKNQREVDSAEYPHHVLT
ncbi:MAG: aldo/keto reductase [Burkholderiaceae bacterium]